MGGGEIPWWVWLLAAIGGLLLLLLIIFCLYKVKGKKRKRFKCTLKRVLKIYPGDPVSSNNLKFIF